MNKRTWFGAVAFFFAWGFVLHGVVLLLHEVGGHGVAELIFGCGVERIDLSYFGRGAMWPAPCARGTWTTRAIIDWAGIAVTISAGAAAMALERRRGLAPMTRLLLALLGTSFLLNQLAYATSGGFRDLNDPSRTAIALGERGLHPLAWLPPLALFAVSAFFGMRAIVDAFRGHFGARSRLHTLGRMAATLGVAGLLYYVAFRIEAAIRPFTIFNVSGAVRGTAPVPPPPFPIERVLIAITVAAFAAALARPVRAGAGDPAGTIPRRHVEIVAVAAIACFCAITVLVRV